MAESYQEIEDSINDAICALNDAEFPNIAKTARQFDIPEQRLRRRYKGVQNKIQCGGKNKKLTESQELALCYYLDRLDESGCILVDGYDDLRGWNPEELEIVLKKGPRNVKHLYTVHRNEGGGFTKPPPELVARAAQQKFALCINAAGEWSLRSSGFVVISHVWSEGLFADLENRGLPSETMDELFGLLEPIDASWIWLDSLAVPGGFVHLSNAEEKIKVDLINNLNMVYERALAVVVLDACVMNMDSNDPLDIAVALICGKWRSRLWTYQEGKLARSVQLLTKEKVVDMHDLVSQLAVRSGYENHELRATTEIVELEARRRYTGPYLSLKSLIKQMHIDQPSGLKDLVDGCGCREASLDIDYARAIFPPLGLVWKEKYTRQDGMRHIFESRKEEAMQLVLSFNAPRLVEGYGWAPSFLEGLQIGQSSEFRWEALGIRKTTKWNAYKVKGELLNKERPQKSFMFNLRVELDGGLAEQYTCGLQLSERERPSARRSFLNACKKGEGFMLSEKPLEAAPAGESGNAAIVLLVKALTQSCEAFVYMTALMTLFERSYDPARVDWLICHHSPLDEEEKHLLHVAPEVVWQNSRVGETKDETALHLASRTRDADSLKKLILGKANLDVIDGRGWTALHVCSDIGDLECVSLLLGNGASVSVLTKQNDSALSLAIQGGHNKIVTALIDYGAPPRVQGPSDSLLVALKTHNHVAISSLLSNSAIPNIQDEHGVPAVFYALERPLILQALLDSGGQVHQFSPSGRSLLSAAAAGGYKASLDMLLKTEVAVDTLDIGKPLTALYHAVNAQEHDCLRSLISAQANVNRIFPGNVSAIMIATANNDFLSAEMLLQAGARLDVRSGPDQDTPLHLAIARGHPRIAKLFFNHLN